MAFIGVFDSGFGGLTILKSIKKKLPFYDYIYLGDNARTPYGNRSFDTVYKYTLECVEYLFNEGCDLVILACNTASAKALRNIQQEVMPYKYPNKRILGVIRPSTEIIGNLSKSKHVGILATEGTVNSESYLIELNKFFPDLIVNQHSCQIWVPLIEYNIYDTVGGKWFIKDDIEKLLNKDKKIDLILLACTHYPLIIDEIRKNVNDEITVLPQSELVSDSLKKYLERHNEIANNCSKNGQVIFLTTDTEEKFEEKGSIFYGEKIKAKKIVISNNNIK